MSKRNGCSFHFEPHGELSLECSNESRCEYKFKSYGFEMSGQCTDRNGFLCTNLKAQNDALTRAAAAINAEQCRRANASKNQDRKIGDFEIWYQKCECGYDPGKSSTEKDARCWRCGSRMLRDFSDLALRRDIEKEVERKR